MPSYLLGDNRANTSSSSGNLIRTTKDGGACTDHLLWPPAAAATDSLGISGDWPSASSSSSSQSSSPFYVEESEQERASAPMQNDGGYTFVAAPEKSREFMAQNIIPNYIADWQMIAQNYLLILLPLKLQSKSSPVQPVSQPASQSQGEKSRLPIILHHWKLLPPSTDPMPSTPRFNCDQKRRQRRGHARHIVQRQLVTPGVTVRLRTWDAMWHFIN